MGFEATLGTRQEKPIGELLAQVQPEDLLKYGLIPEFIGRLPVVATLDDLTEEDFVRILTAPKNALVRQYQKYFDFEKVKLKFTDGALWAIARGLASEDRCTWFALDPRRIMLETMYGAFPQ
jgi:ATP-dependent Clp protease ATP-binding subunit ClpX